MDAHPQSRPPGAGAGAGSEDDAEPPVPSPPVPSPPVPSQPVPGPRQDAEAEDGTAADVAGLEATFTAPEGYELL